MGGHQSMVRAAEGLSKLCNFSFLSAQSLFVMQRRWVICLHTRQWHAKTPVMMPLIFLIENCPESIQEKEDEGDLPSHCACEHVFPRWPLVIRPLFERFPEAIHTKNSKGRFPLHCPFLASSNVSLETFRFLISQLPHVAKVQDEDGLLPLHLVCQNRHCFVNEVEEALKCFDKMSKQSRPRAAHTLSCDSRKF
jgi:hypothetical protein